MESSSSKKRTHGADCLALSKISLTLASLSPNHIVISRKADGLLVPRAVWKCSFVTAIEFSISASIVSSSKSMTSIFSLMHCKAASVQRAARSAPT
ncbi:hypothetical protein Ahy_B08g094033 isoform D [Arachis hypogaea]|uniref:Uncharacterized protein n=1 Tax=Arachis hypogaea TaxID=3818 RepID=A0A444Y7N5_ARAHY|nr:hypothetical protein Ahy_B08g094033 isoform D [Arachis hypogaea]